MTTQPTNNAVPSESPRDLKFNAGKIDEFVTSREEFYQDRFGENHYTIEGLNQVAMNAIASFGYITVDSFERGATITLPNEVLRFESNGQYYRWDGSFPKIVPSNSTPDNTGGIGVGKWLSVGGATNNVFVENYSALKAMIPSYANQVIYMKEYNVGMRLGGGVFVSVTGSATDDGGTICVPTGNTSFYWKRINISEVTPYMFGAVGNGTSDDTTAMQNMMLSGYPVFLTAGQFLITESIGSLTSTVGVSIRGSGDQSVLWYGSTSARLNLVGDGSKVSNVWFRSKVASVPAYIVFGDVNAVIDTNGGTIENCIFGDEQTTFFAADNIRCYNLWYSTIRGNHFRGVGNGTVSVTAIHAYYSVNVSCTDNTFLFMGRCIRWNQNGAPISSPFYNEGWLIGNNAAAAIYTFFYANNGLAAHINNNIIDICFGPAIYSDAGTTRVTDNWIAAQSTNVQSYLVYLSGGFSVLHTNRLVGQTGIGVAVQIGGSPEHIQIQDNNIFGCGTGVSVSTSAPYMVFSGNTALSQKTRSWDLTNASYLTYYGNHFRDSVGATFPLGLLPTTASNLIKKTYTTTVTASLTAGTTGQDFNVTLPAGLFSAKPFGQVTLGSGATGLVVAYVYDSSTTSNAVIRVMNPTGSAIPSATYRFFVTFTDPYY